MCCQHAINALANRLRRTLRDESGTATIEALLWIPVFVSLLVLAVDVSMVFYNQSRMTRVVQDANRSLSVGNLSGADAVIARVKESFAAYGDDVIVTSVVGERVTTTLSIPARDLDVIGLFQSISNATVTVVGEQFVEY